jgi:hypothetical protein
MIVLRQRARPTRCNPAASRKPLHFRNWPGAAHVENENKQSAVAIAALYAQSGTLVNAAGVLTAAEENFANPFQAGLSHQVVTVDQVSLAARDVVVGRASIPTRSGIKWPAGTRDSRRSRAAPGGHLCVSMPPSLASAATANRGAELGGCPCTCRRGRCTLAPEEGSPTLLWRAISEGEPPQRRLTLRHLTMA